MTVSDQSAGGKKRDWRAIRYEYETTGISHRDLSDKHAIPYGTLSKRAMREKWSQRAKLVAATAARLESEIDHRVTQEIRDELAPWIEQRKAEIIKRGYALYEKGAKRIEHIYDNHEIVDAKTESEAARAVETLVRVGRTSLGMNDTSSGPTALSLNILTNQAAVQIVQPSA